MHELGHILFAKYHKLEYRVLFEKGNIRIAADWEKLGGKKVYGNILGIVLVFPRLLLPAGSITLRFFFYCILFHAMTISAP
jgi:hypothetical protein